MKRRMPSNGVVVGTSMKNIFPSYVLPWILPIVQKFLTIRTRQRTSNEYLLFSIEP